MNVYSQKRRLYQWETGRVCLPKGSSVQRQRQDYGIWSMRHPQQPSSQLFLNDQFGRIASIRHIGGGSISTSVSPPCVGGLLGEITPRWRTGQGPVSPRNNYLVRGNQNQGLRKTPGPCASWALG